MMNQRQNYASVEVKPVGDVAVDGLLAGLLAGLVMGAFLVSVELLAGVGVLEALARFDPGGNQSAVSGVLFHLAVSALYGVIGALLFRLVQGRRPSWTRWGWLFGAVYGLALWAVAQAILVPGVYDTADVVPPLLFGLAHLLFGLVLGLVLSRLERNAASKG